MSDSKASRKCPAMYLPNLCGIRTVFAVVIIAQLFAFMLALGPAGDETTDRWSQLGLMSLFIQWIALFSCSILCMVRPLLCRFQVFGVTAISFVILIGITGLFSEITYWLYYEAIWHFDAQWHISFLLRNLGIAAIVSIVVLRYFYVQQQWKHNLEAEAQSRMQALQARIRPHFLFNSMNTIASLTRSDPKRAETAIENLSDLFRASMGDEKKLVSINEELELCRRYLDIETLRLGDRLHIDMQVGDIPASAKIPPLTLQPLLENAIYHGIETSVSGGTIQLSIEHIKHRIQIQISNPIGRDSGSARHQGNQIALDNIRERLAVYLGPEQHLQISLNESEYTVSISLPDKIEE